VLVLVLTVQGSSAALQPAIDTPWLGARMLLLLLLLLTKQLLVRLDNSSVMLSRASTVQAHVLLLLLLLLTPQSRVLLETLTGSQPVKKFPAFYGIRRLITACTIARHLSLS
jgi:hypothetical protein